MEEKAEEKMVVVVGGEDKVHVHTVGKRFWRIVQYHRCVALHVRPCGKFNVVTDVLLYIPVKS